MAQAQVDDPPLTLSELSELLSRHADNATVAKVIQDAIQRRIAEAGTETSAKAGGMEAGSR